MAISKEWQDFIDEYGRDSVYWYFPKGGTADKDEFREQFRVFDLYEGEVWPAPGSEDTKLGVLMGREVRHGASEVYTGVQA